MQQLEPHINAVKAQWEALLQQTYAPPEDFETVKANAQKYGKQYLYFYIALAVVFLLLGVVIGHILMMLVFAAVAVFAHIAFCHDGAKQGEAPKKTEEMSEQKKQEVEVIASLGSKENFDKLKVWSHTSNAEIVFDSEKTPLTSANLNAAIGNQKNIVILIKTKKDFLFGSFTSDVAQLPGEKKVCLNDKKSFVFSINNAFNMQPFKVLKNETDKTLKLFPGDSDTVVEYTKFYKINEKGVKINKKFPEHFEDRSNKGAKVFIGEEDEAVAIDNVKAIRFFDRKTRQ